MFNCFQNSGASQQPVSKPLQRHPASFSDSIVYNLTWAISQQLGKCVTGFVSEFVQCQSENMGIYKTRLSSMTGSL